MELIKEKSLAVASGKGGVGKTTTCVNLAVFFARQGLKTGLIDLDPLSDIATLLDIAENARSSEAADSFESNIIRVLPNLDIIFPDSKLEDRTSGAYNKLVQFQSEIENGYDKLILDLPAGSLYEENLAFLEFTRKIIIVTNDEPTSHTASGHYIKQAHISGDDFEYLLWHNKYAGITVAGFDPGDLPGNYNKNVAEEDQFDFSNLSINDAAFIPHDPAMDLLQSNPSLSVNILAQMSERLEFLVEQRIDELSYSISLPARSGSLIRHYLHLNPYIRSIDTSYEKLSEYIYILLNTKSLSSTGSEYHQTILKGALDVFSDSEKDSIMALLTSLQDDRLLSDLLKASAQLKIAVDDQNNSTRLFFTNPNVGSLKAVDKKISMLLQTLHSERNNHNAYIKSTAGLLLFDFALYKLLSSKTVKDLILNFIPMKTNSRGEEVRDKHSQILQLIKEDDSYKKNYIRLIDVLFPVVLKQIATVVDTFNIAGLIFNNEEGVQKDVYLKLLSAFLHNSINSGLGIVVGFPFRPASSAFEKSAAALI